jgi:hypothetical protein
VHIITGIAAPVGREWQALTAIKEVRAWDGVVPHNVPDRYPEAGLPER